MSEAVLGTGSIGSHARPPRRGMAQQPFQILSQYSRARNCSIPLQSTAPLREYKTMLNMSWFPWFCPLYDFERGKSTVPIQSHQKQINSGSGKVAFEGNH